MDTPNHHPAMVGPVMFADQVLSRDGSLIGISSGRAYSQYYREMLSLCSIDVEYAAMNNNVMRNEAYKDTEKLIQF